MADILPTTEREGVRSPALTFVAVWIAPRVKRGRESLDTCREADFPKIEFCHGQMRLCSFFGQTLDLETCTVTF